MHIPHLLALALPLLASIVSATPVLAERQDAAPFFYKGHDLSSLKILENGGATYKDTLKGNITRPAEDILGNGGMNTVRLRLWIDPPSGQYDLAYTLGLAQRFFKKGYKIYLDFHFSSDWADPQHNFAPPDWPNDHLNHLARKLRRYVHETLKSFKTGGVDLALVSLGNEIRHGMLWPQGRVDVDIQPFCDLVTNFTGLATLYKEARGGIDDAVADGVKRPQAMIHIDNGWNITLQTRWFDAIQATGIVTKADWDVFGFSFYPFYGTNASFANLQETLTYLADMYNKPIQVVETDFPVQCSGTWAPVPELSEPSIPVSVAGQLEWVQRIGEIVKGLPRGLGQGVHYWEPAWLNLTSLGSACEDAILFDADWSQWQTGPVGYSRKSVGMFNQF